MNNYPQVCLGDIVNIVQERMVDRTKWNFDKYVAGEHIESGEVRIRKCGQIKGNEEVIGSAFHMHFKPGHVLYSTRRAYLRKAGIVDFEGICSNVTLVLKAKEKELLQTLLPFILQSEDFVQFAISHSIGSTNPFVKWTDLSKYKIRLPPISIQKKISEMLWAIEDNIEKTENLIQAAERLKEGLLKELLTKGMGHKKFKKTEFGEIPEDWEIQKLGNIAEVNDGSHFSPTFYPQGKHVIATVKNMKENEFDLVTCKRISDEQYLKFRKEGNIAKKGDVIFSKDGTIGQVFVYEDDYEIPLLSSIAIISPSKVLNAYYLCEIFKSELFYSQLSTLQSGTAIKRVVLKSLKKFRIPLPNTIEEQNQIASTLMMNNKTIDKYRNHLHILKNLKRKLMNSLLSGELRSPKEIMR